MDSREDCVLVLNEIAYKEELQLCASYWDELISKHNSPKFCELASERPEDKAHKWINEIEKCLAWYEKIYPEVIHNLKQIGIEKSLLFEENSKDSDLEAFQKILNVMQNLIKPISQTCFLFIAQYKANSKILCTIDILKQGKRIYSKLCNLLISAIEKQNIQGYKKYYEQLKEVFIKYDLIKKREELLSKIDKVAPGWANAIRNHIGIHGQSEVPARLQEAWKLKQLMGIVSELTKEPFDELQASSLRLSKEYREVTSKYAAKSAWYHLLQRIETNKDMQQALVGWKQTVKKMGKNRKNTAKYRNEAVKLMAKCQKAVPAWVMTINQALDSLDASQNIFDYIIIDEASQADIASLAILYMGKKLIIVGDDKQVTPLAIGTKVEKTNALEAMYIKDKIPNSHLYTERASIYEIAATTFQTLMLREHFRCVPEIIGFCNMLSYDNKIKPLRDSSSSELMPAVVNYRVKDGKRSIGKTNDEEAKSIVALMQACIEQPEYKNKTFGVISLLGDEQTKKIQTLVFKYIDSRDIAERSIVCGTAPHFQGDERNIIFLSMVYSGKEDGVLNKVEFGGDDIYKKHYNVAVSRAQDQLWVVHSLDAANDLKSGDIRKRLLDYAANPKACEILREQIYSKADSPFEVAIALELTNRGYRLVQQWKVGAYSIDMVAICGNNKVAIECDGERFHSGEAKIREDMERQTILERLGWRFIRIRGSEYFGNPAKTIECVINELNELGVYQESTEVVKVDVRSSELLERVRTRADEILSFIKKEELEPIDKEAIEFALKK